MHATAWQMGIQQSGKQASLAVQQRIVSSRGNRGVRPSSLRYDDEKLTSASVVNDGVLVCIGNVGSQQSSDAEMHVPELLTV